MNHSLNGEDYVLHEGQLGFGFIEISQSLSDSTINRGTLDRLYYDNAQRIDLEVIETLCDYLDCSISEMFTMEDEK